MTVQITNTNITTENIADLNPISAGEITLSDKDAPYDKIREDKDDVVVGSIKVTNVAGDNLELKSLGLKVVSTGSNVDAIIESFYAEINGNNYELDIDTSTASSNTTFFEDKELDLPLPQGITEIIFKIDTKKNLIAGDTLTFSLDTPTTL